MHRWMDITLVLFLHSHRAMHLIKCVSNTPHSRTARMDLHQPFGVCITQHCVESRISYFLHRLSRKRGCIISGDTRSVGDSGGDSVDK